MSRPAKWLIFWLAWDATWFIIETIWHMLFFSIAFGILLALHGWYALKYLERQGRKFD